MIYFSFRRIDKIHSKNTKCQLLIIQKSRTTVQRTIQKKKKPDESWYCIDCCSTIFLFNSLLSNKIFLAFVVQTLITLHNTGRDLEHEDVLMSAVWTFFFGNPPAIFHFFTLILETPYKTKLHSGNSTNFCQILEILRQIKIKRPLAEISFFLVTPLEIPCYFFDRPGIYEILISSTPPPVQFFLEQRIVFVSTVRGVILLFWYRLFDFELELACLSFI